MNREVESWRDWPLPKAGITLYRWQSGRCAWCGYQDRLVRDHCHETGLVRGLLCYSCNQIEASNWQGVWDAWQAGDHPANALRWFEVYYGFRGATPLRLTAALSYYTALEREAWWAEAEADYEAGGAWPTSAPWTELATARHAAEWDALTAAIGAAS